MLGVPRSPLLVGDLSKLSAENIAEQIREVCESAELRIEVKPLSVMQPQKVVRIFDGKTEVCDIYPAGTHDNNSAMIAIPEGGTSIPLSLKPLIDQLTQSISTKNPQTPTVPVHPKVKKWLGQLGL